MVLVKQKLERVEGIFMDSECVVRGEGDYMDQPFDMKQACRKKLVKGRSVWISMDLEEYMKESAETPCGCKLIVEHFWE